MQVRARQTADLKDALKGLRKDVPFVCVCGNHDIGQTPTPETVAEWEATWGPHMFSFQLHECRMIVLNSQLFKSATQCEVSSDDEGRYMPHRVGWHSASTRRNGCRSGNDSTKKNNEEQGDDAAAGAVQQQLQHAATSKASAPIAQSRPLVVVADACCCRSPLPPPPPPPPCPRDVFHGLSRTRACVHTRAAPCSGTRSEAAALAERGAPAVVATEARGVIAGSRRAPAADCARSLVDASVSQRVGMPSLPWDMLPEMQARPSRRVASLTGARTWCCR